MQKSRVEAATEPTAGGVDVLVAVRAASTAFTVLVLGILATPLVAALPPGEAALWWWPILTVVVGGVVAGWRRSTGAPARQGAAAAAGGYILAVPLVVLMGSVDWWVLVLGGGIAVLAGAVTAVLRGIRTRSARAQNP
ncbi:hypothetical protein BG618_02820 [Pseudonocardia autotrophica]|nr:hypothetical protein BG618_02820 [Pseudonocardia autotrophica]